MSINTVPIHCSIFPTEFNVFYIGYFVSARVGILCSNSGEYFFSHFKCLLLVGSYGNSRQVIVQKFLSAGQQQRPSGFSRELIVSFSSRSFTLKTTESGRKSEVHCVPLLETVNCIVLIVKERVVSLRKV